MAKCRRSSLMLAGLVLGTAHVAAAQSATQTVTFEVQAINKIAVSGNPGPLVISTATAGQQPTPATDASTTYDITTNEANKSIQVALDLAMPAGLTLKIQLAAPTGATSAGAVTLSTIPQNAVTGISNVAQSGLTITYTLTASVTVPPTAQQTRTVTFTII